MTRRYVPRGGFLTDPHEVEQKVPLGGKPAALRAGGGRGPAKAAADPRSAPRPAAQRRAVKPAPARASTEQAAASRAQTALPRAKAALRAPLPEAPPQTHHASKAGTRSMPAAGLVSQHRTASRGSAPQLRLNAQHPGEGMRDSYNVQAGSHPDQHASDPAQGEHAASIVGGGHQGPQPASPAAASRAIDKAPHDGTVPPSPPGVVGDRPGPGGEGWPGSSASGSSVGEDGPQVMSAHGENIAFPTICL